jgi:hypothetical protein
MNNIFEKKSAIIWFPQAIKGAVIYFVSFDTQLN